MRTCVSFHFRSIGDSVRSGPGCYPRFFDAVFFVATHPSRNLECWKVLNRAAGRGKETPVARAPWSQLRAHNVRVATDFGRVARASPGVPGATVRAALVIRPHLALSRLLPLRMVFLRKATRHKACVHRPDMRMLAEH